MLMISEKIVMLWRTRFFTMVVHACTKSINKQGKQKNFFTRVSISFSPELLPSCVRFPQILWS